MSQFPINNLVDTLIQLVRISIKTLKKEHPPCCAYAPFYDFCVFNQTSFVGTDEGRSRVIFSLKFEV
jgi:hypothetical protein